MPFGTCMHVERNNVSALYLEHHHLNNIKCYQKGQLHCSLPDSLVIKAKQRLWGGIAHSQWSHTVYKYIHSSWILQVIPFSHSSSRVPPLSASLKSPHWTFECSPTLSLQAFFPLSMVLTDTSLSICFLACSLQEVNQLSPKVWLDSKQAGTTYLKYFACLWYHALPPPQILPAPFHSRAHPSWLWIQKSNETKKKKPHNLACGH